MTYKRGNVIIVNFPNSDLKTYIQRPALIIQDENVVTGLNQRIVALITSTKRVGESRVQVKKDTAEGKEMGIRTDSTIVTDNIATVFDAAINRSIGICNDMNKIDNALRKILRLSP